MGFREETYEVGFVQQIDLVQPGLTVREILEFAARHMGLQAAEAEQRAAKAGELCNLGPLMDRVAQLGNGQLNLSGGQLKRVCVAIEVLRQPRILVLDEPTTGQDPKNTDDLMNLFRSLAQDRVTLLMSTHDLRNLALFDKVARPVPRASRLLRPTRWLRGSLPGTDRRSTSTSRCPIARNGWPRRPRSRRSSGPPRCTRSTVEAVG